jgi:hypothetical protein
MIQSNIGQVVFTAAFDDHQPLHDWYASLPDTEAKRGIVEVYHKAGSPFSLFVLCTGPSQAAHEAYSRTSGSTREKVLDFAIGQFSRWIKTQDVPREALLNGGAGKVSWSMAISPEGAGTRYTVEECSQIEENLAVADRLTIAGESPENSSNRKILANVYPEWLAVVEDLRAQKRDVYTPKPLLGEAAIKSIRDALAA